MLCGGLASSLLKRLSHASDNTLLDEAIELGREALSLQPTGHIFRATPRRRLAQVLTKRFRETWDSLHLDEVIKLEREALGLCPPGHPDHPASCITLAFSLRKRMEIPGSEISEQPTFDEVAALLTEALPHYPQGHPALWRCRSQLAEVAFASSDWAVGMEYLRVALDLPTYDDINDALQYLVHIIINRVNAAALSSDEQRALLSLYDNATELMILATNSALDASTQLRNMLPGHAIGPRAFMLATRLADLPTGLQLLERARGIIWSQMLHVRDPQVAGVPVALAQRLQSLLRSTSPGTQSENSRGPSAHLSSRDSLYTRRREAQDVTRQIRILPGLSEFMRGPDAEKLMTTARRGCIVVLVADENEGHVLVMAGEDRPLVDITIPEVNQEALKRLTLMDLTPASRGLTTQSDTLERGMKVVSPKQSKSVAHTRLKTLWLTVVKPVIVHLGLSVRAEDKRGQKCTDQHIQKTRGRARPRIHWCCTGAFAFVPVHAAGLYAGASPECCSDYVVSSYTPTLAALLRAQEHPRAFTPGEMKVLTIAAEQPQDTHMPALECVVQEAQDVLDIVTKSRAAGSSDTGAASTSDVLVMLQSANVVHIACHGVQHASEPHKSRFCLSTGDLSVSELMETNLEHAFFAFLSACETAKGDRTHADEVIHLAATMLFAGFKSVAATMWWV
jgi:hypothetical protein